MNIYWFNVVGWLGGIAILLAFFLLQARQLRGDGLAYQLLNIAGAIAVIVAIGYGREAISWAAVVMQVAWIAIGVFGIVRSMRLRRERREAERAGL